MSKCQKEIEVTLDDVLYVDSILDQMQTSATFSFSPAFTISMEFKAVVYFSSAGFEEEN